MYKRPNGWVAQGIGTKGGFLFIGDFIDLNNPEHLKAMDYLRQQGHWPVGFLPDDVEPTDINEQIVLTMFKVSNAYLDEKLKGIK